LAPFLLYIKDINHRHSAMTRTNIDNIKAVYQLATLTEQQDGISWYPTA